MRSTEHEKHVRNLVRYSDCRECSADRERGFVQTDPWNYKHVHEYLAYIRPRCKAINAGTDTADSRRWLREFRQALDTRINLKTGSPQWRKLSHSYLERLAQFRSRQDGRFFADARFLRQFADNGASAL